MTDEELVQHAAELAHMITVSDGALPLYQHLLAAAAAQRDEARRHELARQAQEMAGAISTAALAILRVVVFGLAA